MSGSTCRPAALLAYPLLGCNNDSAIPHPVATPCYDPIASPYMHMHSTCPLLRALCAAMRPILVRKAPTHSHAHIMNRRYSCDAAATSTHPSTLTWLMPCPSCWRVFQHSPATLPHHAQHPKTATAALAAVGPRCTCTASSPSTNADATTHHTCTDH